MKITDLAQHRCEWLRGVGPSHDVVISSRARLARNIAGMPFLPKCSDQQKSDLEKKMRQELLDAKFATDVFYVDIASASEADRELLVERHLISRQHAKAKHPRGLAVSGNETLAIMVNEEDHLRIQGIRSGFQMRQAVDDIIRVDKALEEQMDFAFHSKFGYLTACPTNTGTGLRVSVMLHLPALKMTGQIEKLFRAASDMHLAVRGFYGEGTDPSGDFFQISNQTTLGKSEEQISGEFSGEIIPDFVDYERKARESLAKKHKISVQDRIFRSLGILRSARLISSDETLHHLSIVRMGVNMGQIPDVDLKTINELLLLTQPVHLQRIHDREMPPAERAKVRAGFIQQKLNG